MTETIMGLTRAAVRRLFRRETTASVRVLDGAVDGGQAEDRMCGQVLTGVVDEPGVLVGYTIGGDQSVPVKVPFGGDRPPVTWMVGGAGSGKTLLLNRLAAGFRALHPDGVIFMLNVMPFEEPDPVDGMTHIQVGGLDDPLSVLFALTAIEEALGDHDVPTLICVDDAPYVMGVVAERSDRGRAWAGLPDLMVRLARQGRSAQVWTVVTSQVEDVPFPSGQHAEMWSQVNGAVGCRVWLGRDVVRGRWAHFFDQRSDDCLLKPLSGYGDGWLGWLSIEGGPPVLFDFRTHV